MLGLKPLNYMGYLGNWVSGISHFLLAAAGLAVAMEMKRKTIMSVKWILSCQSAKKPYHQVQSLLSHPSLGLTQFLLTP